MPKTEQKTPDYRLILDVMVAQAGNDAQLYRDAVVMLTEVQRQDPHFERAYCRWFREKAKDAVYENSKVYDFDACEHIMQSLKMMCDLDAQFDLDAFMQAMEWNRDPLKKFWQPRRRCLMPVCWQLQDLFDRRLEFLSISLPPRVGKALADDTPVLTKAGWKTHGELAVGDLVASPYGGYVRVLKVHPKCQMEYEVEFTNGEKITCHGNHEWLVHNRHKQKTLLMETKEILSSLPLTSGELGKRGGRYCYQLENKTPLDCEDVDLPVKPYSFGVWLGDGANKGPRICGSQKDMAIIEREIEQDGYTKSWETVQENTGVKYAAFNELRKELQTVGMCHSRKIQPKYIPDAYFTASKRQRLELLAGLLDTDGCLVKKENRYQFTTSEESLRDSFVRLIATFGWRCSIDERKPYTSSSGVTAKKNYWVVAFNPTEHIPCRLERKSLHTFSKQRRVAIRSIRKIEDSVQGNCITVEGGMYCAGNTLLPTHNTTLCTFYLAMNMGNYPDDSSAMGGYNDELATSFHAEIISLIEDKTGEYRFAEIFPDSPFKGKSLEKKTADLRHAHTRFHTVFCRGVGGTWTGAVEIGSNGMLYCDDLVKKREESLNDALMQKLYSAYLGEMKDRKLNGARELFVGTRWVPNDPIGRIEEQHGDDPMYRFYVLPALNDEGESNFMFDINPFTKEYYENMCRDLIDAGDEDEWWAKYMGKPYRREGALYDATELRLFVDTPAGEPDAVMAVCDTKWKGADYCVMPIVEVYGEDHYVVSVICSDSPMERITPRLIDALCEYKVTLCRFESNVAGGSIAIEVEEACKKRGLAIDMRTKYSTENKETRIEADAGWVKQHCLFPATTAGEYKVFMRFLTSYSLKGKNKHDDVPDAMSMYKRFVESTSVAHVSAFRRPF